MQFYQQVGPLVFKTNIGDDSEIQDRQDEIQQAAEQTIRQVNQSVLKQTARRVSEVMTHLQIASEFQLKLQQLQALARDWQAATDRKTKAAITRQMGPIAQHVEDILRGDDDPQLHVDYSLSNDEILKHVDIIQNQHYARQLFEFTDVYLSMKYQFDDKAAFYFRGSIKSYLLAQHGSVAEHYQVIQEFADLLTAETLFTERHDLDGFSEIKPHLPGLPRLIRSADDVVWSGCQAQLIENVTAANHWVYCPDARLSQMQIK